jgi:hypothetical protein|tara:strand:+ start:473 stop:985 length:513 start_codon:yes stop_codon:yes gene_type:complete
MSTNDKYLVLRGKNKDIYFIQKRVSKKISLIIGKEFIKKSLETNDINIARERRDKILNELKELEINYIERDIPIEINDTDLIKGSDERINTSKESIEASSISNSITDNNLENQNVRINDNLIYEKKDESDGYFSFIDYSKLPKKQDISNFLDKLLPVAIVFLVIFITLLV